MGCGFSRRVDPNNGSADPAVAGVSSPSTGPDAAAAGRNSSAKENKIADSSAAARKSSAPQQKDSSLSFVIPIGAQDQDSKEGSLIRKHPPIRLRRLEEEQQILRTKLTLDDLEKRQAEAEERRRKILDSRVQSAQHFQRKVHHQQQNREEESEPEEDEEEEGGRATMMAKARTNPPTVSPPPPDWGRDDASKNPPQRLQDFRKSGDENIIDSLVNNNKPRNLNHDQLS